MVVGWTLPFASNSVEEIFQIGQHDMAVDTTLWEYFGG